MRLSVLTFLTLVLWANAQNEFPGGISGMYPMDLLCDMATATHHFEDTWGADVEQNSQDGIALGDSPVTLPVDIGCPGCPNGNGGNCFLCCQENGYSSGGSCGGALFMYCYCVG